MHKVLAAGLGLGADAASTSELHENSEGEALMTMTKRTYSTQRDVLTYTQLASAAFSGLKQAQVGEKVHQFNNCMTAMLFCALTLEAYLNYLAWKKLTCWEAVEHLQPKEKLSLLAEISGFKPDMGRKPFQSFTVIFAFRNKVAHGKPEELSAEGVACIEEHESPPMALTAWEKEVSLQNAERFVCDTVAMIGEANKRALREPANWDMNGSTYWMRAEPCDEAES